MKGKLMRENKLEKLIQYIGDSVYDVIASEFDKQSGSYFEDKHINDDTMVDFAEYFDGWNGFEFWMEKLKKDKNFQDDLMALVKHITWTREPIK